MTVQVAPTAIDRSIARRRHLHRRHQSLRAGAPAASGSSLRWRTGVMLEAWQRPLLGTGIDGEALSLRPPQNCWHAESLWTRTQTLVQFRCVPADGISAAAEIKGTSARPARQLMLS